jgi:formylglycine-generating enzyme required for sulfatase activity
MPTTTLIQGFSPADYAALWGSTDRDGVYFYNFGSELQVKNATWLAAFGRVILRQMADVVDRPNLYQPGDLDGLDDLHGHVMEMLQDAPI